jgi:tRNA A-37 threonylcarbamoyl transferase component Bud32
MATDFTGYTFGSYKLVELLGRGGMASVYRGYQESIDRSVAVKILPPEFLHDVNFSERFTAEARLLAKLTHPAILPLYDFGDAHDVPYIVMPLMAGGTLADQLLRNRLSLPELIRIFTPIADALDFAHTSGVIHRDVKPSNILFDARRQPFLADFGIAKAMEGSSSLTGTGIIGTPDYMSPEQARGETLDGRSDLYSLGVMAYQCLSGDMLFKATTPIGVMLMHATEPPPPIRQRRPEIPAGVEAVLIQGLAKQPADRYPTGQSFMQAMAAGAGAPAGAYPPGAAATGRVDRPPTGTMDRPATGSVNRPPTGTGRQTAPQPPRMPTVETPPPPRGGFNFGALVGGGLGMVIGITVAVILSIVCCVGVVVIAQQATPTPKPTATAAVTATPTAPALLLSDTFDNPNSGWDTTNDPIGTIAYIKGEYAFNIAQTGWFVWGTPVKDSYANFSTQVNARYVGGNYTDILFGIMCNIQDNKHYYYAGIDTSGYYAIGKQKGGTETVLTGDGKLKASKQLAQGGGWFRLNFDCTSKGQLSLYVDGVLIDYATDTDFTSGNVGLFTDVYAPASGPANQPVKVEVHFDDVAVSRLP